MSEDPITKAVREAASAMGIDVPESSGANEENVGVFPLVDVRATKDPERIAVTDGMHWARPKPMPYNGMDIVGYSIQYLIDDMDRDFDRDKHDDMFGMSL